MTTNIKLHFFKTTLNDTMNIDGINTKNAFGILKERVINSTPETEEQSLILLNIFMLIHLGHMAISFPNSGDSNIYGFGPKITKQSFIDSPSQFLSGGLEVPAWFNPMYIFYINLQGDFTHNNFFFNYINKPENNDLKLKNYIEIDLQINDTKEDALQKLRENITYYGYPPNSQKDNCISYIFKILKPKYIGIDTPIKLNNIGHLSSNLSQLLLDSSMVENYFKNKSLNKSESKKESAAHVTSLPTRTSRPPPPRRSGPPPAAPQQSVSEKWSQNMPPPAFGGRKRKSKTRRKKRKKKKTKRRTKKRKRKRKTKRKTKRKR